MISLAVIVVTIGIIISAIGSITTVVGNNCIDPKKKVRIPFIKNKEK